MFVVAFGVPLVLTLHGRAWNRWGSLGRRVPGADDARPVGYFAAATIGAATSNAG